MFRDLPPAVRTFLGGRWASSAGDWLGMTALGWVIVCILQGGSSSFAISRLLSAIGVILMSSMAGPMLYRFSGAALLLFSCVTGAAISLTLASVFSWHTQPQANASELMLFLYTIAFIGGMVLAFRDTGEQRVQSLLVPRERQDDLESAWTRLHYAGRICFGLLSGFLLMLVGAPLLFVLDGMTFLVLAAFTLRTRRLAPEIMTVKQRPLAQPRVITPVEERPIARRRKRLVKLFDGIFYGVRHYTEAIQYVRKRPDYILLFWILFVVEGIGFTAWNLMPEIISKEFHEDGFAYGFIVCLGGVGGLIGIVSRDRLLRRKPNWGPGIFIAGTLFAPLGLVFASLSPGYILFGVSYMLALFGWAWFLPPLRVYCRNDEHGPLVCAVQTLVLLGLSRLAQVGLVFLFVNGLGLPASTGLRISAVSSIVLLLATYATFSGQLRRTMSAVCNPAPIAPAPSAAADVEVVCATVPDTSSPEADE